MEWHRLRWLAVGLLAFWAAPAQAQQTFGSLADPVRRASLGDPEPEQEPVPPAPPVRPSSPATAAPARPVTPPRPSATTPPATPAATPATPATTPAYPDDASALVAPPLTAPPTSANAASSGFLGSDLFAQRNSAFQASAGTRPSRTVEFLGDDLGKLTLSAFAQTAPPVPPSPPGLPGPRPVPGPPNGNTPNIVKHGAILVPSVRGFKIAEGQTPRPVDRVYYFTNYFNNVNYQINRQYGSQISSIMAYRNTFGFEKTFLDGNASLGLQLPINTLAVGTRAATGTGSTTSVGDLSLISKYAFWSDEKTGSIFSGGLAFTAPTGTSYFGGNRTVTNLHFAGLTPYVGYIWARDRFFFQGFNSLSVPVGSQDVTYFYNDLGMGYYVYRSDQPKDWLTAIVPTFEVHVNTPLNHRGGYLKDPAATPDVVDFTYGVSAFFFERTKAAIGVVTPVTGPRPFEFEILANLTYRF